MRVLLDDRTARVEASLPRVLGELVRSEPASSLPPHEEKHVRWEHARAAAVADVVESALSGGGAGREWVAAEGAWNQFLHALVSGRKQNSEGVAGLMALVGPATLALSPLLAFLLRVGGVSEERLLGARGFYARAVSSLLRAHSLGAGAREEGVAWLRRHDWGEVLPELLRPFLQCEVEPLAKELAFHFQDGKKTARREEPQHFFSFLFQLYERYDRDTRAHGWVRRKSEGQDSTGLTALGSVALASTAISLFRGVYGWHEGSRLLRANDFAVHGVNSFVDFLGRARGVAHEGALLLFAENILLPSALRVFFETARVTAERAFVSGARALWRREFLVAVSPRAFATVCGTQHMLRCLEALVRRLAVVFTLFPSCALNLWERTIVPCMSLFLDALDTAKESCDAQLDVVVLFLELIDCAHVMHSAAEGWMEQCGGAEITAAPLDRLALWRDELTRETARDVKSFLSARLFGAAGTTEQDLCAWEAMLCVLERGKVPAHVIVYEDMKLTLAQLTTTEQREQLRDYCKMRGMEAICTILQSIAA